MVEELQLLGGNGRLKRIVKVEKEDRPLEMQLLEGPMECRVMEKTNSPRTVW